ncbi:MAG: TonB-dependent receptor plug domain-containing protein [Planctomycetota bacterium]
MHHTLVPSLARLVLASSCFLTTAYAEDVDGDDPGETIVVTATRDQADRDTVPTIVEVITDAQLERAGFPLRIQDQIRNISGVTVQRNSGGFAGGGGIYVRGARGHQTQLLLDGIPFNDPSTANGNVGHHLFTLPGLSSIELAKGAQSGIHGSGATGGALNLRSLEPAAEPGASVRLEYGSFSTITGEASATGPITEDLGFSIALNGLVSDGFSSQASYAADGDPAGFEDDAFERLGVRGRLAWERDDTRIHLSALMLDAAEDYDATGPDDRDASLDMDSIRIAAGGEVGVTEQSTIAGDAAYTTYEREFAGSAPFEGGDLYGSLRGIFDLHTTTELTVGLDYRDQSVESEGLDESSDIVGAWAQTAILYENWHGQVVLRHATHSREGDAFTYRIGASYAMLDERLVVHAAHGTGFRAPTPYELFAPPISFFGTLYPVGNEDLEAERTATWEIGHRSEIQETFELEQTVFYTVFEEAIAYGNGFENVEPDDTAYVLGIENTGVWQPIDGLQIRATLTVQDSDNGSEAGNELTFTPSVHGGLQATYEFRAWEQDLWVSAGIDHRGEQYQDSDNTLEHDAITTLHAVVGWRPTERYTVYLRGDNLTDETEAVYIAEPSMFGSGYTSTMAPLSVAIGAQATF